MGGSVRNSDGTNPKIPNFEQDELVMIEIRTSRTWFHYPKIEHGTPELRTLLGQTSA